VDPEERETKVKEHLKKYSPEKRDASLDEALNTPSNTEIAQQIPLLKKVMKELEEEEREVKSNQNPKTEQDPKSLKDKILIYTKRKLCKNY
jgi:hypothetical protein